MPKKKLISISIDSDAYAELIERSDATGSLVSPSTIAADIVTRETVGRKWTDGRRAPAERNEE